MRLTRRGMLRLAGGLSVTAGCVGVPSSETWPAYQGGPAHLGRLDAVTPPVGPLNARWHGGVTDPETTVTTSPVTVDGAVVVPGIDGTVRAFDLEDGERRWQFGTGRTVTTPATDGETVYVGSKDGYIYALDAATGTEQWRYDTGFHYDVRLTLADGVVYAGLSEDLVALDAATGTERWRVAVGDPGSRSRVIGSAPAVADGRVYVADYDARVYALAAATGRRRWTADFPTAYAVSQPLTVHDGTVYAGNGAGRVLALAAASGRVRWRYAHLKSFVDASLAVGERIYVKYGASDVAPDGRVVALDPGTGTLRWEFRPEQEGFPADWHRGDAAPVVGDGVVHVGLGRNLYRLDAASGSELGRAALPSPAAGSPAVTDGRLAVRSLDGGVHVFAGEK